MLNFSHEQTEMFSNQTDRQKLKKMAESCDSVTELDWWLVCVVKS